MDIKTVIKRFDEAYEAERDNFEKATEDLEFVSADDQWSAEDKAARAGRPCLTINKTAHYQDIIEGDYRQNRPALKIIPVDDKADPKVAEVLTGLVRNIENQSNAKIAYTACFSPMASGGIGNIRVTTKYVDDQSFEQDIVIDPVNNPFEVLYDPRAERYDRQDGNYMFAFADIPREEFKERFPNARCVDFSEADDLIKKNKWVQQDLIRIAEYFEKSYETKTLYLDVDGNATFERPEQYTQSRTVKKYKIIRHLVSGVEELEEPREWPSKYFPNVPAYGKTTNIRGERKVRGSVRFAKDPNRAYNYWRSASTEQVAMAPKAPWLLTPKMISGHESMWDTAHKENRPYLLFNVDKAVQGLLPQRTPPAQIPTGVANEIAMADGEIRDTMNVNLAKAGLVSNERSGKAIRERRRGSDTANYTYLDNMAWTHESVGRILLDLIPKIYDTERIVRIMNEDGTVQSAKFGRTGYPVQEVVNEMDEIIDRIYDPNVGKYDVVVSIGPSYSTQRQEAADNMFSIMQTSPDIAKLTADLLFQYQDFPGADKIAERIRKTLPPQLLDEDGNAIPREQVEAMINEGVQQGIAQFEQSVEAQTAQVKLEQEKVKLDQEALELKGKEIENQIKQSELEATDERIKQRVAEMVQRGEL